MKRCDKYTGHLPEQGNSAHSLLIGNNESTEPERRESGTRGKKFIHKCMMFIHGVFQSHSQQATTVIYFRKLERHLYASKHLFDFLQRCVFIFLAFNRLICQHYFLLSHTKYLMCLLAIKCCVYSTVIQTVFTVCHLTSSSSISRVLSDDFLAVAMLCSTGALNCITAHIKVICNRFLFKKMPKYMM